MFLAVSFIFCGSYFWFEVRGPTRELKAGNQQLKLL